MTTDGTEKFEGFGQALSSPNDLLKKLKFDFSRMSKNSCDVYAAYDFFVTAHHLHNWVLPNQNLARKTEEDNNPILSICAHIANGSKHFVLGDKHTAVKDISVTGHFFGGKFFDGNFFGDLYIELSGVTAQQFGEKIDALSLAKEVLAFWKKDSRLKIALPAKDNA